MIGDIYSIHVIYVIYDILYIYLDISSFGFWKVDLQPFLYLLAIGGAWHFSGKSRLLRIELLGSLVGEWLAPAM